MNLLAIDTSTDACTVGLLLGDEFLIDHRIAAQQHGALVLPMVDALLSKAGIKPTQLDGLVYGRGPGSFTGVRIGVAVTQGIALGADVGVIGISTMHSIAQGTYRECQTKSVLVSIDARMDEVYCAAYELNAHGLMSACSEEYLCAPDDIPTSLLSMCEVWAGSGAERYANILSAKYSVPANGIVLHKLPQAQDLLELARPLVENGALNAPENARPVYLRDKVADTTAERALAKAAVKNA